MNITLSICMIIRDEEAVLERCLNNAAKIADELIIVDTGSKDNSVEIAKRYTDKVFFFPWEDDFAKARNASYSHATMDYIMWLDADDDIKQEDIDRICALKHNMPENADVILFSYLCETHDGMSRSNAVMRDRMIRRALHPVWEFPIHEAIPICSDWNVLAMPDIRIFHDKLAVNEEGRNLRIFEKKIAEGFILNSYNRAYYCRELSSAGRYEEAVREFERLWEETAKYDIDYALIFYISAMKGLHRHEALEERLREYSSRFGERPLCRCIIGDMCRRRGDYVSALEQYKMAREAELPHTINIVFPDYRDLYPLLGMCKAYYQMGQKALAVSTLEQAEKIAPNCLESKLLKLRFSMS